MLLRGVDLTTKTFPVPAAFLHSVLRLSLSVSAHTSLPFLASCACPRLVSLRAPPCARCSTAPPAMAVAAAMALAMATAGLCAAQPSTKVLHLHSGPGGSGGDRTRLKNILVRTSSTAAELSPRNHHRRQLGGAHCDHSARHTQNRCLVQPVGSHDIALPSPHHRHPPPIPHRAPCTAVATRASAAAAEPLSCAQPRPVAGFPLLKRTHPDAGLHTPCYSCPTHTHALPLAAPHVATLGSRVLQIPPPFRQTCLPASIAKQPPPLLRFRVLRIPSSPPSNSGFARLYLHKRLLVLHFASLHPATPTTSRAPLIDLVTAT